MSAGAPPQTPLWEFTALPRLPSWILGAYFEGEGRDERGREGRAEKGRKGKRGGKDRMGVGGGGGSTPKLKLGPQNYFPGAGAVESACWTSY